MHGRLLLSVLDDLGGIDADGLAPPVLRPGGFEIQSRHSRVPAFLVVAQREEAVLSRGEMRRMAPPVGPFVGSRATGRRQREPGDRQQAQSPHAHHCRVLRLCAARGLPPETQVLYQTTARVTPTL